jgi:uracil-DNA glycosylase
MSKLTWKQFFDDEQVNLRDLIINSEWDEFFNNVEHEDYFHELQDDLTTAVQRESIKPIYPLPQRVFYPMNILDPKAIKVIIIGQDPYFNLDPNTNEPQAMGLAFSVPCGSKIPPSLLNIYKNMVKFNHLKCMPKTGNLKPWLKQGVFLFNACLTVEAGHAGSHCDLWSAFMEDLIEYIVDVNPDVVMALWGKNALAIKSILGNDYNYTISSHPSPLSNTKSLGKYPPFADTDHFSEINDRLQEQGLQPIDWNKGVC